MSLGYPRKWKRKKPNWAPLGCLWEDDVEMSDMWNGGGPRLIAVKLHNCPWRAERISWDPSRVRATGVVVACCPALQSFLQVSAAEDPLLCSGLPCSTLSQVLPLLPHLCQGKQIIFFSCLGFSVSPKELILLTLAFFGSSLFYSSSSEYSNSPSMSVFPFSAGNLTRNFPI